MTVEDPYLIAWEIGKADISALSPEKIAAAIRASQTILAAWSGSADIMRRVYARAAELLDVMADMAAKNVNRNGGEK